MNFVESVHCKSRAHCTTCRADAGWRAKLGAPETCPHGVITGLGDVVAAVATPIARALGLDCIDKQTGDLKPESRCSGKKDKWNKRFPLK